MTVRPNKIKLDVHQAITDQIVARLETSDGQVTLPWIRSGPPRFGRGGSCRCKGIAPVGKVSYHVVPYPGDSTGTSCGGSIIGSFEASQAWF